MDEIPYIHEDRPESHGEDGECRSIQPTIKHLIFSSSNEKKKFPENVFFHK